MALQDAIAIRPVADALERAQAGKGYWTRVRQRVLADRVTIAVMMLLALIVVMALAAPLIAPYDPTAASVFARLKSPGYPGHWLGTDEVGRDLWSRILYGGRLSLLCGVAPVAFALAIGGSLGLVAGYRGGIVNSLVMRGMDVLYAFPSILLAIAICGMLGSGLGNTILALTVTFIPPIVRIAETVTAQVRSFEFVEAARASGARPLSIIRFHILNNVLGPILVYATSLISISIILAAGLSFLGLGVTPPDAEWGLMLNNLRQAIWVNPLVAALPGVMIFITSMSFNLLSDGLRSAMDVRL
ncbi:MAG TPA: ABC transporter permease [Xanthobacteraceae bacterium]|jgi:peptide/nickel transport system permease protein|nr:ABC transporter permease [Xanthobacteraceae bacterium]